MTKPSSVDRDGIRRVLEERARKLARPLAPPRPTDVLNVVVFQIAAERYAVEATRVREVFRLLSRTPLPGAPDPIAGVTSHRGDLLTLLDLRSMLGLSVGALNDLARVMVLERGRTRVGILIDRVEGMLVLSRSDLRSPPRHGAGPSEHLVGITDDALIVLDVDVILRLFDGE